MAVLILNCCYKILKIDPYCWKKGVGKMVMVKVFDYEHEKDLEKELNQFLRKLDEKQLIDIKYHVAAMYEEGDEEQIYCFSAMVIYRE